MVEAYRAAGSAAEPGAGSPADQLSAPIAPDGPAVLAVIDVPGDEVVLVVIVAPDAASAERLVSGTGMRPIRVVPVQWDASGAAG